VSDDFPSAEVVSALDLETLPVLIAADVGDLATPDGQVFGAVRLRWATAATYDEGNNDRITTIIIPAVELAVELVDDLNKIIPHLTETLETE